MIRPFVLCCLLSLSLACSVAAADEPTIHLATFDVDATPPVGSVVAYAPVKSIVDPLHAKGIVLLSDGQKPIVICVFDWIGIANGSQDWWRNELAVAARTTADRVAVHTVHQHDGPRCDVSAVALFSDPQQAQPHFDMEFILRVRGDLVRAISDALQNAQPVTHIGTGKSLVEKVASNRRLLGPDGKVAKMRFSSCRDADVIAAPEGVIDPFVRLVSFWNGEQALACLAYYATHPMSHYGKGDVSADFPGLARADREQTTGVTHIYFTGAGGNVAAGKYNDGSDEMRPVLTQRLSDAMRRAWESTSKVALSAADVRWTVVPVTLPVASHLQADELRATLQKVDTSDADRLAAASDLAFLERCLAGRQIELSGLRLGPAWLIQMPGELFVEYALAAQQMRPDDFVCLAAYGDYGPGYIGTEVGYSQGGYETSPRASLVAPAVENVLLDALRKLLQ